MTDLQKAMQLAANEEAKVKSINYSNGWNGSTSFREQDEIEIARRMAVGKPGSPTPPTPPSTLGYGDIANVSKSYPYTMETRKESDIERCERLAREQGSQPSVAQLRNEVQPKIGLYQQVEAVQDRWPGTYHQPLPAPYPNIEAGISPILMGRKKAQKRTLLVERMYQPIM